MKYGKIVWAFLLFGLLLYVSVPTKASTLTGNENGKAAGQTSVTARVELPEGYEPNSSEQDDGTIRTGDSTNIGSYVVLFAGTAMFMIGMGFLKKQKVLNE